MSYPKQRRIRHWGMVAAMGLASPGLASRAEGSVLTLFNFNDLPPSGTTTSPTVNHLAGVPPVISARVVQSGVDSVNGGATGHAFTDADGTSQAAGLAFDFGAGVTDLSDQIQFTFNPSACRNLVLSYDYRSTSDGPGSATIFFKTESQQFYSPLGFDSYTNDSTWRRATRSLVPPGPGMPANALSGIGAASSVSILIRPDSGTPMTAGSIRFDNLQLAGSPALTGDTNGDGTVNFSDVLTLIQHYGQSGTVNHGDFNNDGSINFTDALALIQHYGSTALTAGGQSAASVGAAAPIPEPTSAALISLAACPLIPRRRRR